MFITVITAYSSWVLSNVKNYKMYSTETFSGKACQSSKHGDAWLSEKWWRERITKIYGHLVDLNLNTKHDTNR